MYCDTRILERHIEVCERSKAQVQHLLDKYGSELTQLPDQPYEWYGTGPFGAFRLVTNGLVPELIFKRYDLVMHAPQILMGKVSVNPISSARPGEGKAGLFCTDYEGWFRWALGHSRKHPLQPLTHWEKADQLMWEKKRAQEYEYQMGRYLYRKDNPTLFDRFMVIATYPLNWKHIAFVIFIFYVLPSLIAYLSR